jgi:hypothetical protein
MAGTPYLLALNMAGLYATNTIVSEIWKNPNRTKNPVFGEQNRTKTVGVQKLSGTLSNQNTVGHWLFLIEQKKLIN